MRSHQHFQRKLTRFDYFDSNFEPSRTRKVCVDTYSGLSFQKTRSLQRKHVDKVSFFLKSRIQSTHFVVISLLLRHDELTMVIPVVSDTFIHLNRQVFGKPLNGRASREEMKGFRSVYGASPKVCGDIFRRLSGRIHQPIHLLWTMAFLKLYLSGNAFAKLFNVTRKTFFCYVWPGVRAIASLKPSVVRWENRLCNDKGRTCKITVDGTDFKIYEPSPFSKKWYSHRFKSAGLRYEVGVCISTGDIVWTYGPFPCGSFNDIKIYRRRLVAMLSAAGEKAEADKGYRGEPSVTRVPTDWINVSEKRAKQNARARHEMVNKDLKQFGCLKQVYRHDLKKHKGIFDAVTTITQLKYEHGNRPWQIQY